MVRRFHYSGRTVPNSKLHLGLYGDCGSLRGVLSFGPPINGSKTLGKVSKSTKALELNRMVMHDDEPRNSESMAISACIKWLKQNTDTEWILSFSDGGVGNVGYIYQATNWKYIGFMKSGSLSYVDGERVHEVTIWHRYKEGREGSTVENMLSAGVSEYSRTVTKQHVYVMPLRKWVRFNYTEKPYPKADSELMVYEWRHVITGGRLDRNTVRVADIGKPVW